MVGKLTCRATDDKVPCDVWKDPVVAPSAHRQGLDDDAIPHAFRNPIRSEDLDEGMTMLIGPDRAGNLIEVGVVGSEEGPVIVHAMSARPKYLR